MQTLKLFKALKDSRSFVETNIGLHIQGIYSVSLQIGISYYQKWKVTITLVSSPIENFLISHILKQK